MQRILRDGAGAAGSSTGAIAALRVLQVTNMWPEPEAPHFGAFVAAQVASLERLGLSCPVVYARSDYRRLRRLFREHIARARPHVVHAHFGYTAAAIADVCARARLPLVVSYCGGDLQQEPGTWRRVQKARVGRFASILAGFLADALIVKSESMTRCLPATLRRRALVLPNGVDTDAFAPRDMAASRAALGWPLDEFVALFGGRPDDPTKNLALARQGVEAANARGGNIVLRLLRGVPHDQVAGWLNAADVVMLTSVKEGSPNIIKEACACDRPIVSVDVGDVAQVLAGVSGTHVVPSERAAIAEALLRVAACPPPRRSDGRRALAEKGLDADTVARRLLRLYGQLAAGATINALPGGQ